jgi:hypothetical protein
VLLLLLLLLLLLHTLYCQEFFTMAFASRSLARRSGEALVALRERATMSCRGSAVTSMRQVRGQQTAPDINKTSWKRTTSCLSNGAMLSAA